MTTPTANPVAYDTLAAAQAAHVPPGYASLTLRGYYAAGDGPEAPYVSASSGAAPGKFQSADGAWWALNPNLRIGFAEWFGATRNSVSFDNGPVINNCIAYYPITALLTGIYYINTLISIQANGKVLTGIAQSQLQAIGSFGGPGTGTIDPNATNIVVLNNGTGTLSAIQIGSSAGSQPSQLVQFVRLKDLNICNATASATLGVSGALIIQNPSSGFAGCPTGVIMRWCVNVTVERVLCSEFSLGFSRFGTVETYLQNCTALRYTPGIVNGNDFWTGFFQDNSAPLGANSGNASCYTTQCRAFSNAYVIAGAPGYSYNAGLQTYRGFTDTYVTQLETGNTGYGADFEGRGTGVDNQTEDLIVRGCVFDGVRFAGIKVAEGGPKTAVVLADNYVGCSNASGPSTIGIQLSQLHGSLVQHGNQIIASPGNPATGISANTCSGIVSRSNTITDIQDPIIITACVNLRFADRINFAAEGPATAAVQVNGLTRGVLDCDISSSNASFTIPIGYDLQGSSNTNVTCRMGNVDATYITTSPLVSNGVAITRNGLFGGGNRAVEFNTDPTAYSLTVLTGSGTFTTGSDSNTLTLYRYRAVGGGGGGGGANGSGAGGSGGGAGGYVEGYFTGVAASTGISITIGGGGAAGANTGTNGGNGGTTTIGSPVSVSAGPGAAGTGSTSSTVSNNNGGLGGGTSGSPTLGSNGGDGGNGLVISGSTGMGGFGGASAFGGGGRGSGVATSAGGNGFAYGSGGGGGAGASQGGGTGAAGVVIIERMSA